MTQENKWQPLMVIAPHRLECKCGAIAIFAVLDSEIPNEDEGPQFGMACWCQSCFKQAQEEV